MQSKTAVNHSIEAAREARAPQKNATASSLPKPPVSQFVPLEVETRPTVSTDAAAHYLHLACQTLRIYACKENGPLRPRRINGRLHWATADIRKLLGVA